ncbi:hypothetical protein QBC46DRAFT_343354 [Diplogelasinospora grovesii]|uniref:Uncharacterized protein n=1 Tax=Diplogelasinospora grovesii TaxID=303347 RepID=A0AAN6N5L2_9PEZI|nr:hypothetical protein QBC46DRAFT_343354 [Diplogelasinospora grovesii]
MQIAFLLPPRKHTVAYNYLDKVLPSLAAPARTTPPRTSHSPSTGIHPRQPWQDPKEGRKHSRSDGRRLCRQQQQQQQQHHERGKLETWAGLRLETFVFGPFRVETPDVSLAGMGFRQSRRTRKQDGRRGKWRQQYRE